MSIEQCQIEIAVNKDVDISTDRQFWSIFVQNLKAVRLKLFALSCQTEIVYGQNWRDGRLTDGLTALSWGDLTKNQLLKYSKGNHEKFTTFS